MVTEQDVPKVTYTTMSVDQADLFHRAFDRALDTARERLGETHPLVIGGRERETARTFEDRSPNDTRLLLGRFAVPAQADVDDAVEAAHRAYQEWGHVPYERRIELLRRVADTFRKNRFELAAVLSLEAGKPRLEAVGEVEEAADLITTYCDEMEENDGFVRKMGQLSPQEVNYSVLRPYGVWAVIAPFNFPIALATGMIAGALVAGNTVVFKPAPETPYSGLLVYRQFEAVGLPDGVINYLSDEGDAAGRSLVDDPRVDGVAFIGSKGAGYSILKKGLLNYPRPVIAEMGGKNPVLVMASADLEKAVVGTARAAFGYSGQKCSAASRAYVHNAVRDEFIRRLADYTAGLAVGDPAERDVFMGPVVNEDAYVRFQEAARTASVEGDVVVGGHVITEGEMTHGYYVQPTVVAGLPKDHPFFREELFVPFITVAGVDSLDEALALSNASEFGLTAGIFTEDESEQQQFLDRMQAGVLYVNRAGGATTGAWPGIQSFGGWKGSGSSGKSALGPYYVMQFMHEQNQTVVRD